MEKGENLPAGEPHADRLDSFYGRFNKRALATVIGAWSGIVATTGVVSLVETEPLREIEFAELIEYDHEFSFDITTTSEPEPVTRTETTFTSPPKRTRLTTTSTSTTTTTIPTTTTTLPPETTTTSLLPPPETTATTITQELSCQENISIVDRLIPDPDGWEILCMPPSEAYDGMTFAERKIVEIYFRDKNDSDLKVQRTVAHEKAHEWQVTLGMTTATEAVIDPLTGQPMIDASTGQPIMKKRYTNGQLEWQADNFAHAFGFGGGSNRGARIACQVFRDWGANLC